VHGDEAGDRLVIDMARCFATVDAIVGSIEPRCGRAEGHERHLRAAASAGVVADLDVIRYEPDAQGRGNGTC
jgi:hypothetical protein